LDLGKINFAIDLVYKTVSFFNLEMRMNAMLSVSLDEEFGRFFSHSSNVIVD